MTRDNVAKQRAAQLSAIQRHYPSADPATGVTYSWPTPERGTQKPSSFQFRQAAKHSGVLEPKRKK